MTPEPAKSVPTAAQQRRQWDRLRLELLTDDLDLEVIEAARDDPAVPTDAELREQAKRSASLSHRREGNQRRFRDDMFDLLMGR